MPGGRADLRRFPSSCTERRWPACSTRRWACPSSSCRAPSCSSWWSLSCPKPRKRGPVLIVALVVMGLVWHVLRRCACLAATDRRRFSGRRGGVSAVIPELRRAEPTVPIPQSARRLATPAPIWSAGVEKEIGCGRLSVQAGGPPGAGRADRQVGARAGRRRQHAAADHPLSGGIGSSVDRRAQERASSRSCRRRPVPSRRSAKTSRPE